LPRDAAFEHGVEDDEHASHDRDDDIGGGAPGFAVAGGGAEEVVEGELADGGMERTVRTSWRPPRTRRRPS
jgi:hypothetical protein